MYLCAVIFLTGMSSSKIVILGASPNPARYSYMAANALASRNFDIVPVGLRNGEVAGKTILDIRTKPQIEGVHTITLYMNARNQEAYHQYIIDLKPERIIFNPGAENEKLASIASKHEIHLIYNCTLVMLSTGTF